MKYEDNNNNNDKSVFSYYGEDSKELNDSFEKLMSENKKPIYTKTKKESIFTSQDSFEKNSNIKKFHVVAKTAEVPQDIQELDETEFDDTTLTQESDDFTDQDFDFSSYTQSSYINDFDIIDEPEETYDDIKNEISKTTQEQLLNLDKYASSGFESKMPEQTDFNVNNNYKKSYDQIPTYAPKSSYSKSSKDNQRNTLVYNIINKNTGKNFVQDISSNSANTSSSTIQKIPVREISNMLASHDNHEIKTDANTQTTINQFNTTKLKDENESNDILSHSNTKLAKTAATSNSANNSKVVEFPVAKEKRTKAPKNKANNTISTPKADSNNKPIAKKKPTKPKPQPAQQKHQQKAQQSKSKKPKKSNEDTVAIIAKIVAAVLAVGVVFGLVFYLFIGVEVASINVVGDSAYAQSDIVRACEIELTDNILRVSTIELEEKLTTQLPYLSEVEVSKSLSDGLSIEIISTTSDKTSIQSEESYFTIDENNKIVSLALSSSQSTYVFVGFDYEDVSIGQTYVASEENQARYEIMQQLIEQFDLSEIDVEFYVDVSDIESVIVYCNDSLIEIRLGEVLFPENVVNSFAILSSYDETASGYINAYSNGDLTVNIS